ncbi:MAG: DNA polymerase III subunit alpha [Chloroflexia bacterium]
MGFIHLHCHSAYSLLEGTATPQKLLVAAKRHNMNALALTDRNTLYGAVLFYMQAQKAGIKPVIGMEVDLDDGSSLVLLARNIDGYRNLCQLATVLRLNSDPAAFQPPGYEEDEGIPFWEQGVWGVPVFGFTSKPGKAVLTPTQSFPKEPRLPREMLLSGRHTRGLIALSGGRRGLFNSLVMQGKFDKAARSIGTLISAFGEGNIFIELQLLDEQDAAALPSLVKLANDMGAPVVATNNVLYLSSDDAPTAIALASARSGLRRKVHSAHTPAMNDIEGDAIRKSVGTERYFKSPGEMAKLFAEYPQAIANTQYIADQCNLELPLHTPLFPSVSLTKKETPFSRLWKICFAGATRRYRPLTEAALARLKYELEIIQQLGFSPYFLTVYDIVHFAHSQSIPIMARGSAANSLVAYVLGITQVEPLEKDLLFERFLNPSRAEFEMPDIDLDLCWRRRDEVLHYIYQRYGRDHVATVGTHITFRLRSAWREMAKVMGVSPNRISYIAHRLPHVFEVQEGQEAIDNTQFEDPEQEEDTASDADVGKSLRFRDETERTAFKLAQSIVGLPRHAGMHCAGVIITPQPLTDLIPLQRAARDPSMSITQYEKDAIEALGLVKLDILGSRALTTLVDAVMSSGISMDLPGRNDADLEKRFQAIPLNDPSTFRIMSEGQTLGCFQLESPGMRGLLKWLRPRNLDEVATAISLFRPGPLEGGFLETFMRRHLNQEEITYSHPSMEPILRDTKGVILFQEQFLKLVNRLAGVSLGEAEKLRKALGKTRSPDERARLGSQFVSGAIERGIDQLQAQKVWDIVAGYSGFGFCAAHAHSYALVAYRSAYMKAHYPAEFLSAQINNGGGYYGPSVYIEEARRLRVKLLLPDVNESGAMCEVKTGSKERRSIRIGLQFVKGLSEKTIEATITERRNNGRFKSLPDLMARVSMKPQEIQALVKVGACDDLTKASATSINSMRTIVPVLGSLGETIETVYETHEPATSLNRKQMMWLLPSILSVGEKGAKNNSARYTRLMQAAGSERQGIQFMMDGLIETQSAWRSGSESSKARVLGTSGTFGTSGNRRRIEVPSLPEHTLSEKLRLEREALGFVLSCNEMELIDVQGAIPSSQLRRYGDREVKIAGVIAAGRSHMGKDGNKMLFLTLQDREGLIEVVVFSDAYKKYGELLASNGYGPYEITGIAQVSGKGRGIGVQPSSDLLMSDAVTMKMHPVVIANKIQVIDLSAPIQPLS